MALHPLAYSPPTRRRPVNWQIVFWLVPSAGFIVAVLAGLTVPVRDVRYGVDPVTGSEIRTSTWPFGITTAPQVTPSPLEVELRACEVSPQWR